MTTPEADLATAQLVTRLRNTLCNTLPYQGISVWFKDGAYHVNVPFEEQERELAKPAAVPGRKNDAEKPRYDLLPLRATDSLVDVLTFGAKKYAPWNWRKVEGWRWRYYAAALRHLFAWKRGEVFDADSGLPHLAHARQ